VLRVTRTLPLILATLVALQPVRAQDLPTKPDAAKSYVFYLHGRIIENGNPKPVDKAWGLYDYPEVVRALGSRGAVVLSEQRPKDTDIREYAAKVRGQITRLVQAGVPQSKIAVVGFSKGGSIAGTVSGSLGKQYPDIRYVFLAACTDWILDQPTLQLSGHVLAINESSDEATTGCSGLTPHAGKLKESSEITIHTGAGHGAFYLPRDVWVKPTLQWIHGG